MLRHTLVPQAVLREGRFRTISANSGQSRRWRRSQHRR